MKPILQSLLIADRVYQDVSRKFLICGTFNQITLPSRENAAAIKAEAKKEIDPKRQQAIERALSSAQPEMGSAYVYMSLTEMRGIVPVSLQYVELATNRVIFRIDLSFESQDPIATTEFAMPLPRLLSPREGTFALELHAEHEMLGSHRIRVIRAA